MASGGPLWIRFAVRVATPRFVELKGRFCCQSRRGPNPASLPRLKRRCVLDRNGNRRQKVNAAKTLDPRSLIFGRYLRLRLCLRSGSGSNRCRNRDDNRCRWHGFVRIRTVGRRERVRVTFASPFCGGCGGHGNLPRKSGVTARAVVPDYPGNVFGRETSAAVGEIVP